MITNYVVPVYASKVEKISNAAVKDYTSVISLYNSYGNEEAYLKRGEIYFTRKEYEKAWTDFAEYLGLNPGKSVEYKISADEYYRRKSFAEAIVFYSALIKNQPNNAELYKQRGYSYHRRGDFSHAIEDFNAALKLNPHLSGGINSRKKRPIVFETEEELEMKKILALCMVLTACTAAGSWAQNKGTDQKEAEDNICLVHQTEMSMRKVRMLFGIAPQYPSRPYSWADKERLFPNCDDPVLGGCVITAVDIRVGFEAGKIVAGFFGDKYVCEFCNHERDLRLKKAY